MIWIDWVFLAVLGISAFWGMRRGLILEAFAFVALIVGIGAGFMFYEPIGKWLDGLFDHKGTALFLGFTMTFLCAGSVVLFLGQQVRTFVHMVFFGWADTLLGGFIGLTKGALAIWVLLVYAVAYLPPVEKAVEKSEMAPVILDLTENAQEILPGDLWAQLEDRLGDLQKLWKQIDKR
jgi:membrane protein required for colicin V production